MLPFYSWFYRHYWWLLIVIFTLTFLIPWATGVLHKPLTVAVLLGINISVFYFAQRQRLADRRLAARFSIHFGERWAQLHPKIEAIHQEGDVGEFTAVQLDDLMAYFDWCGQLHFNYARNHIPAEAWQSWLKCMRVFYYNSRIRRFWESELKKDIYFGFDARLLK